MEILKQMQDHEELRIIQEKNILFIFAIHRKGNGTTFGGSRLIMSKDHDCLKDALRFSKAMTYKLRLIDEEFGGSKAVILIHGEKTKIALENISKTIESLNGKLITSIDYGFEPEDADYMKKFTKYLFATPCSEYGLSGTTTANGVLLGIKTCLKEKFGKDDIKGRKFAVQGLGNVGRVLTEMIIQEGGKVFISDINEERLKQFKEKATIVSPKDILYSDVDVLCPCGPAYVVNKYTIPKLKCKIIAGGANCPLDDEFEDDKNLWSKKILFAPDFVINAGGVMQGIAEYKKHNLQSAIDRLPIIQKNLKRIFKTAKEKNIGTLHAAKEFAKRK